MTTTATRTPSVITVDFTVDSVGAQSLPTPYAPPKTKPLGSPRPSDIDAGKVLAVFALTFAAMAVLGFVLALAHWPL